KTVVRFDTRSPGRDTAAKASIRRLRPPPPRPRNARPRRGNVSSDVPSFYFLHFGQSTRSITPLLNQECTGVRSSLLSSGICPPGSSSRSHDANPVGVGHTIHPHRRVAT